MSMILPTFVAPYEDESAYSWLHRLAASNGYSNCGDMMRRDPMTHSLVSEVPADNNYGGIVSLCALFGDSEKMMQLFLNAFKATSLYPTLFPMMLPAQQLNIVNFMFNPLSKTSLLSRRPIPVREDLMMCPECVKQEHAQGYPLIFHRSHQIPGVKICPKHHCQLLKFIGKPGEEYSGIENYCAEGNITAADDGYAGFANDFSNMNITCSRKDISQLIINIRNREELIAANPLYKDIAVSIDSLSKRGIYQHQSYNYEAILKLLYICYGSAYKIQVALPKIDNKKDKLFQLLQSRHYSLISQYFSPVMLFRDDEYGSSFITSEVALLMGWDSYYRLQVKTDAENFDHLAKIAVGSKFDILGQFTKLGNPMPLQCKKCGAVINVQAKKILYGNPQCDCEKKNASKNFAAARIAELGLNNQYDFLSLNGVNEPCDIKCKCCGSVIHSKRLFWFLKKPQCPTCNGLGGGAFDLRLRKKVGNEFIRVGEFKNVRTKVKIMHTKCGKVFKYSPLCLYNRNTLCCPYCQRNSPRFVSFQKYVKKITRGEYEIIDYISNKQEYCIVQVKTKKRKWLKKAKLVCELEKAGKSKKLPLSFKNNSLDEIEGTELVSTSDSFDKKGEKQ